jgi:hypothetical protein
MVRPHAPASRPPLLPLLLLLLLPLLLLLLLDTGQMLFHG